jgi:hypothetical protein
MSSATLALSHRSHIAHEGILLKRILIFRCAIRESFWHTNTALGLDQGIHDRAGLARIYSIVSITAATPVRVVSSSRLSSARSTLL